MKVKLEKQERKKERKKNKKAKQRPKIAHNLLVFYLHASFFFEFNSTQQPKQGAEKQQEQNITIINNGIHKLSMQLQISINTIYYII